MRLFIAVIFLVIHLLCSGVPASTAETIVLTNGEWPPLFSEQFKHGGVGSLICSSAFAAVGVEVKYVYLPWKRAMDSAKEGEFAGTVGWRKRPKWDKYFYFSDPILIEKTVFFHKEGKEFDWETLGDIGRMRVGGTLGYQSAEMLEVPIAENGGKLYYAPSDTLNFQMLAEGRIDVFPCSINVGYYILRTQFLPGVADIIQHHPKPLMQGGLHLLISKKTKNGKQLVERFNQGLQELKKSGRYDEIIAASFRGEYMPE